MGPNVTYVDHKSIDRLVPYQFAGSESPEEHNKSSRCVSINVRKANLSKELTTLASRCLCNVQRLFRVFKFSRFRLVSYNQVTTVCIALKSLP